MLPPTVPLRPNILNHNMSYDVFIQYLLLDELCFFSSRFSVSRLLCQVIMLAQPLSLPCLLMYHIFPSIRCPIAWKPLGRHAGSSWNTRSPKLPVSSSVLMSCWTLRPVHSLMLFNLALVSCLSVLHHLIVSLSSTPARCPRWVSAIRAPGRFCI